MQNNNGDFILKVVDGKIVLDPVESAKNDCTSCISPASQKANFKDTRYKFRPLNEI